MKSPWLTTAQAAEYLGKSTKALDDFIRKHNQRAQHDTTLTPVHKGKLGQQVRYHIDDLNSLFRHPTRRAS